MHRIVLLGGYGNTGRRIARLLAPRADVALVVAGRSPGLAEAMAASLGETAARPVQAAAVDVRDPHQRRALFAGASLVVAASSTTDHAVDIVRDAVAAGADALDTNLSVAAKIAALRSMAAEVVRLGRTVVTDGGCHPGLPGVMVRHAESLVPGLVTARVGGSFNIAWRSLTFSEATIGEFVDELSQMTPGEFVDGRWVRRWSARRFDFGAPVGRRACVPWDIEEMRELPAACPALRNTGFYVAGFAPLVDYVAMPAAIAALRIAPAQRKRIGRAFLWALRHWTPRGDWTVLQLEGEGGVPARRVQMRVAHPDGYALTAYPVAACVEQLLDAPRRPGVFTQAGFVRPAAFLRRLAELGATVETTVD